MKIGTLADWFGVGLIEGIRESERCGAQGVQVYAAGELHPKDLTREKLELVKRTARDCHQQVSALCGELGGYGFEKSEDNPEKIAYLKSVIDLAGELDCGVVTTHIGVVPASKSDPTYRVMLEAMQEVGAYAAARGAYIAVETGPEKISRLAAFVDDCGKGVAINYDPANIVMVSGEDPVPGVFDAGKRIVHTHAKDGLCLEPNDPAVHYHWFAEYGLEGMRERATCRETPLGEGAVDWERYLQALHQIGYDGFLTIEREVKNGAEDIRMAVGFLRNWLLKLGY